MTPHFLTPHRLPGESAVNYRTRRRLGNRRVDQLLRGTYAHVSSRIVTLPPAGKDEKIDEAIRRGELREVTATLDAQQKPIRIGRTKGVTYRKSVALPLAPRKAVTGL